METKQSGGLLKFILVFLGVVILGAFVYISWYFYQKSRTSPSETGSRMDCNNLSATDWLTYSDGYTIKYPADWDYQKEQAGQEKLKWYLSFSPTGDAKIIKVGGSATNLDEFKQEITTVMTPAHTIEKEETATIDGKSGTKLTVQKIGTAYKIYLYFVPFLNVPYVFSGPATENASQFQKCEPQIFQKMLEMFKFPTTPIGGTGSSSGLEQYANLDYKFQFNYPTGWEIKSVSIYETAGGVKATTPTIIIGKKSDPATATTNQILINQRQGFCQTEGTKSTDTAGSEALTFYTYPGSTDACGEAQVNGLDVNGKTVPYYFLVRFNDATAKDAFKEIVKSFSVIK